MCAFGTWKNSKQKKAFICEYMPVYLFLSGGTAAAIIGCTHHILDYFACKCRPLQRRLSITEDIFDLRPKTGFHVIDLSSSKISNFLNGESIKYISQPTVHRCQSTCCRVGLSQVIRHDKSPFLTIHVSICSVSLKNTV